MTHQRHLRKNLLQMNRCGKHGIGTCLPKSLVVLESTSSSCRSLGLRYKICVSSSVDAHTHTHTHHKHSHHKHSSGQSAQPHITSQIHTLHTFTYTHIHTHTHNYIPTHTHNYHIHIHTHKHISNMCVVLIDGSKVPYHNFKHALSVTHCKSIIIIFWHSFHSYRFVFIYDYCFS